MEDFLAVLKLHQGRLEALNCVQDFIAEVFVLDLDQDLLNNIVSILVVNELLNYKIDPCLHV